MPIVGESIREAQSVHHGEGYLIHDTRITRPTSGVCFPSKRKIVVSRLDQLGVIQKVPAQLDNLLSKGSARGSVAAFEYDVGARPEISPLGGESRKHPLRNVVPLVACIPERQKSDRIEIHALHG